MRPEFKRFRLGLLASAAVVGLLGLLATPGSAKTLRFHGEGVGPPIQTKVSLHFKVVIKHHKLSYAHHFKATKLAARNTTPPIPLGEPGQALCAGNSQRFDYLFQGFYDLPPESYKIDFRDAHPTNFHRKEQYPAAPAPPSQEWIVDGHVSSHKRHGNRIWHSSGSLVLARSEGGLQYGGCSTGRVLWEARAD
jgi:hypothetical protein